MKLLIIDNYDSFVYNIGQYVGELGFDFTIRKNNDLDDLKKESIEKIIISPGPGNPENPGDRGNVTEFLKEHDESTVLGICFGHQLLGYITGSKIFRMNRQYHGEVDTIKHFGSKLYENIPESFKAIRYHSLSITENEKIVVDCLSTTDKSIMGFHSRDGKFFGVQFHPESFYSEYGKQILLNFMVSA